MKKENPPSRRGLVGHLLRGLYWADRVISTLEDWTLAVGILLMAAVTIANVVGRNIFGHSLAFAEEIDEILIVLVTFIGVGFAARQGRHIRMTAFYDQLPLQWKRRLMVLITAGTGALLFALAWYALTYVLQTHSVGSVTPSLQIPLYLVYAAVPVGLFLGGLQYLMAAVRNLVADEPYVSFSRPDRHEEEATPGAL
ncbi:MAG: TRAP transporter small permease [Gammaproteobacteria bacterium]|jgi:TRAP-type C4-dicarboxylate transport system permease small subunit